MVNDPVHLFDANIFYPERHTLAFSEHLFVQSMIGAPVRWAGGSPILVYNIVFIAGLALTGWAMAVVIHRWTGSWPAGILSGSLMAFNALTLTRFPHIQIQHLEFLPLALLGLDRLLTTPRLKHAVHLAAWYVLQSLTSLYLSGLHDHRPCGIGVVATRGVDRTARAPGAAAGSGVGIARGTCADAVSRALHARSTRTGNVRANAGRNRQIFGKLGELSRDRWNLPHHHLGCAVLDDGSRRRAVSALWGWRSH